MNPNTETAVDDTVQRVLAAHQDLPGALLPVLHAIQEAHGYIPDSSVAPIAQALNLSRAEVHGVITYFHFFRREPPGRHLIQVCRAEACQACGSEQLLAEAEKKLGCKLHETRADGAVTLEPVYCLGLCASAPSLQVDDQVHARMTSAKLAKLLAELEAAR
ncbi:MAG: formate dehydrogenase subunit gamma [Opitutales bacterium]